MSNFQTTWQVCLPLATVTFKKFGWYLPLIGYGRRPWRGLIVANGHDVKATWFAPWQSGSCVLVFWNNMKQCWKKPLQELWRGIQSHRHCQQDLPIPVICFHGVLTFPMSSNPPISARLALEGQLVQDCQQGINSQWSRRSILNINHIIFDDLETVFLTPRGWWIFVAWWNIRTNHETHWFANGLANFQFLKFQCCHHYGQRCARCLLHCSVSRCHLFTDCSVHFSSFFNHFWSIFVSFPVLLNHFWWLIIEWCRLCMYYTLWFAFGWN